MEKYCNNGVLKSNSSAFSTFLQTDPFWSSFAFYYLSDYAVLPPSFSLTRLRVRTFCIHTMQLWWWKTMIFMLTRFLLIYKLNDLSSGCSFLSQVFSSWHVTADMQQISLCFTVLGQVQALYLCLSCFPLSDINRHVCLTVKQTF